MGQNSIVYRWFDFYQVCIFGLWTAAQKGFPGGSDSGAYACNAGDLYQEDPLEKEMATHSSTLAWKFDGWRSLVGYSPRVHKELDTTERLHFHFSL